MDITPSPSLIESIRKQNLPWHIILGEMIDNAFDAAAKEVVICFEKKRMTCRDDGDGCADVSRILTLGDRRDHKTTELGRYGIGAKDAAISAAGAIKIDTTCKGIRSTISCDWNRLEKQAVWKIDDPIVATTDRVSGTLLVLDPLRSDRIHNEQTLINRLSMLYSPAIRQGRSIKIQFSAKKPLTVIPEFRFPQLEHQVTADLCVDDKKAKVTLGIVPDGQVVEHSGLIISYGWRVIKTESRVGLGDQPTPGLFGLIELGSGWELTKNKNNIICSLEELGRQIAVACEETIAIASSRAQDVVFDGISSDINAALESIMNPLVVADRKAKRGPATSPTGAAVPTGLGGKHRRALVTQVGNTFPESNKASRSLKMIRVAFESQGIGGPVCRYGHPVVYLNKDIPELVNAAKKDPNSIKVHAIYAASVWAATDEGVQKRFWSQHDPVTIFDKVSYLAGKLLSSVGASPVSTDQELSQRPVPESKEVLCLA